ncbi:MAG TPA: hypothetical protein VGP16_32930 [Asanoa sp.]|nr:hypothetical protein [Asanoa sp.]
MTIRVSARIACLAVVAAEATAVATRADEPSTIRFAYVFLALQIVAVGWATDRRSAVVLTAVAPALMTAVTAAAIWTALALAVPVIATGDTAALVAILAAGLAVAASSRRSAGQRLLPLLLIASAGSALLIFLVISCVLPMVPGFVSDNHPPIHADVTRMVDPVGELGVFLLLSVALGVDLLHARIRTRRAAGREQRLDHITGPNEMVVERSA